MSPNNLNDHFDVDYPEGPILTADQVRELDRTTIEILSLEPDHLMKEAAAAILGAYLDRYRYANRVAIICGKGNNGGDGIYAARLLSRYADEVRCFVIASRDNFAFDIAGLNVVFADSDWLAALDEFNPELVIDALLGIGLRGEPTGEIAHAIDWINSGNRPVIAVDVPSGVDADSGQAPGKAVQASLTVTMGVAKPFLFQSEGADLSGEWRVGSLSYDIEAAATEAQGNLITREEVDEDVPARWAASNKGDNGHVLIVAGSPSMPGAAVLAARGALRAGAGLVTICSHPSVCTAVSHHLPEVLLWPIHGSGEASSAIVSGANRFDAAVFGPGLGQAEDVRALLRSVWEGWGLPCVVDADALNLVAAGLKPPKGLCVLTPHPGEMGRLMGVSTDEIQADRFGWAKRAAEKLGEVVVLKGAYSVVSEAGQPLAVNPTGNPGMATGGMGDVLAGVIGTLLAQEVDRFAAAKCGVFWHGVAGDQCRVEIGEVGFTASELADRLPRARDAIKLI